VGAASFNGLNELLNNKRALKELLLLEKERRGIERDKLLFVGVANVASYRWCAVKSLLASKRGELSFFAAYLEDRIKYSLELGYVDSVPTSKEKLLDVGDEVTLDDIERLLAKRGELEIIPEPVGTDEAPPMIAGELLHWSKAERYPTIRWNFPWRGYVVVGVPDGITDSFVYEFKTTGNDFLLRFIKPVAFAQADLYGYFFRRGTKRVQVYVREGGRVLTWMDDVASDNAEGTLQRFKRLEEGEEPSPPKKWKCKKCEFRRECMHYQRA